MNTNPDRTPYCHKIRYGISGAPILTEDEMDGTHAPGVGVRPKLIEFVYSAARDGKPASVSASVTGAWTRFGEPADGQVTAHFVGDPSGWPVWLAAEARLHDPAAGPVPPPTDQTAEDHRLALSMALNLGTGAPWDAIHDRATELGLPPLDQDPVALRLGLLAAYRAKLLTEAADALDADMERFFTEWPDEPRNSPYALGRKDAATELRRLAAEAPTTTKPETDEDPARIDRLRPEFTEHSSVEAIDAQLRRSRAQERRWHIRTEWLISLRADRVAQKERGEWPAAGVRQDGAQPQEVVHGCPPDGSGLTPCCGRTPFELPRTDRISSEPAAVTCAPAVVAQPGKET